MKTIEITGKLMIELAKKRIPLVKRKGWDWKSYYNGFLDGMVTMKIIKDKNKVPGDTNTKNGADHHDKNNGRRHVKRMKRLPVLQQKAIIQAYKQNNIMKTGIKLVYLKACSDKQFIQDCWDFDNTKAPTVHTDMIKKHLFACSYIGWLNGKYGPEKAKQILNN